MKYVKPLSLYQDLQKLHPSKRGRLLGLTVGADIFWAYRVGVAVSDANNEVASPYCVMERKKLDDEGNHVYNSIFATAFQDLINRFPVSGIIIGQRKDPREIKIKTTYPFSSSLLREAGFPGDPSGKLEVKKFVDYLSRPGRLESVPYTYWEEEHLLHKRCEYILYGSRREPELSEQILDIKNAASGTLQRYLHAMKNYPESGHDYELEI